MNTTPWFDGDVKPARPGLYQLKCGFGCDIGYQHWGGRFWGAWDGRPEVAFNMRAFPAAVQNDPWRGLACKPATGA